MLKSPDSSNKGLTLVEMQISAAITVIVIVAAMSLYLMAWRSFALGNGYMDIYSDSRMAMEKMARDIRWGAQIESSYGGYTTANNSMILKIPSVNTSGDVVGGYYDRVIYNVSSDNKLHRIVRIDTAVPNSGRSNDDRVIAKNCSPSNFLLGTVDEGTGAFQSLGSVPILSTINNVAVSLPISSSMLSFSGGTTQQVALTPTTTIRLRNK